MPIESFKKLPDLLWLYTHIRRGSQKI